MALKKFNPTTPSQRGLVLVDRSALHKGDPVKALTQGLSKKGGRNNHGRITARRRGGGHKRLYRLVDFKRRKFDVAAKVVRLEYDPNRTAFIALIEYEDGELSYILAPQRLGPGDMVIRFNSSNKVLMPPAYWTTPSADTSTLRTGSPVSGCSILTTSAPMLSCQLLIMG